jgi:hypothetical protein
MTLAGSSAKAGFVSSTFTDKLHPSNKLQELAPLTEWSRKEWSVLAQELLDASRPDVGYRAGVIVGSLKIRLCTACA